MHGGTRTDVAIMDFSKAFDKVPHQRLLLKLNHYGVRGETLSWIGGFLSNRRQRVLVDGVASPWASVRSGVPQGTVLGPLLFLAYINDLPNYTDSPIRLFADDCLLYRHIKSVQDTEILQRDLDNLAAWERTWQMEFNPSKCHIMHITRQTRSRIPCPVYSLRGNDLDPVDTATYLGVDLHKDLSWGPHITKITGRASRTLGFLKRNIRTSSKTSKERVYRALVRPTLEYACAVWDPYQMNHISQLERVQRRAARYVCNRYHNTSSVTGMLSGLGWESLQERRSKFRLVMLYKIVNNLVAIPTTPYLKPAHARTRRNHHLCFFLPFASTDYYKHTFFIATLPLWNNLPATVAEAETLELFRTELSGASFHN
jgi:ribonuclease P/MRP protein subunit RPP40